MRILHCVAVMGTISLVQFAGCGDDEANKPVDLKPADTSQFNDMKDAMLKTGPSGAKTSPTKP